MAAVRSWLTSFISEGCILRLLKLSSPFTLRKRHQMDEVGCSLSRERCSPSFFDSTAALPEASISQRVVTVQDQRKALKADVRAYAYNGQVQLFAARLYDGQTTNFRSDGGGFAPVFVTPT